MLDDLVTQDLPSLYDRQYFLSNFCEGSEHFMDGAGLSPLKTRQVKMLAPGPGRRVLDAGCGRGEVLLALAKAGAEVAGIDFSPAAIEIAKETMSGFDADLRQGSVLALPWPDGHFDAILTGDVIEHLFPADTHQFFCELRRVLKPGGRLVLHTSPNRLFLDYTWPVARRLLGALGYPDTVKKLDWWISTSKRYHFNEQTLFSLRRGALGAGFEDPHVWIDANMIRGGTHHLTEGLERSRTMMLGTWLSRLRAVRLLCGNDLWVVAHR